LASVLLNCIRDNIRPEELQIVKKGTNGSIPPLAQQERGIHVVKRSGEEVVDDVVVDDGIRRRAVEVAQVGCENRLELRRG
jgi:hypothetical protein